MFPIRQSRIHTWLTLAALAFTAAACPAQAQFNTINTLFPTAPRIGMALGGGVLGTTLAMPTFANPLAANPFQNNSGFVTPFAGLSPVFVGNPASFNNLPRNIVFGGNGTNLPLTQVGGAGANQLLSDPLFGFQQPRTIIDPFSSGLLTASGTLVGTGALPVNTSLFFQSNPGLSPFVVNGAVPGSVGFNTFNTLSPTVATVTPFTTFNTFGSLNTLNTGFGGTGVPISAGMLTTQAFVNNAANAQAMRVSRAAPPFNPSIPNPPPSPFRQVASATSSMIPATALATNSGLNQTMTRAQQMHWPSTWTNPNLDSVTAAQTRAQMMHWPTTWTNPYLDSAARMPMAAGYQIAGSAPGNLSYRAPLVTPPVMYGSPISGIRRPFGWPPVIGGPPVIAFGPGMGTSPVVMGGRAAVGVRAR